VLAKQRGAYTDRKKALVTERIEELRTRAGNGENKTLTLQWVTNSYQETVTFIGQDDTKKLH
jgi:hypothetical protein